MIHKNRWLFIQCQPGCYVVRITDRIITVWMQWSLCGNSKETSHCVQHKQVIYTGHNWHLLNATFSFRTSISYKIRQCNMQVAQVWCTVSVTKVSCILVFKNMHIHSFRSQVTRNVSNNHCVLQWKSNMLHWKSISDVTGIEQAWLKKIMPNLRH